MLRSVGLFLCALLFAGTASSQQIIVNEFYRSGTLAATGNEWIEVLLTEDLTAAELETYLVGDSQGTTNSKLGAYQFTNMGAIASEFRAGTLIVLTGGAGVTVDTSYDPDNDDWNLVLASNGPNITAVNNGGDLAGTDVVWVDTVATGTAISPDGFCVNYDSTPGTLGQTCQVTITAPANNTGSALDGAVFFANQSAAWTSSLGILDLSPGQPNGGDNTLSILDLRGVGGGGPPVLSIADESILEGDSGDFPVMTFTATLDRPAVGNCFFNMETFVPGGTPNGATPDVDYVSIDLRNLVIFSGQTSTTFDVTIIGDDLAEGDEIFTVSAFGEPFDCDISSAGAIGTIIDDDLVLPTVSIDDVSIVEGTGPGTTEAVFTVSLSSAAPGPDGSSVDFTTVDGSAIAPDDYASTSGTLSFAAAGPLTQTITVPIVRDNIFEADETFTVVLSNPLGATLGNDTGQGTIENDDGFPVPSINDVSQLEGTGGSTDFVFTISLSNPSASTVEFSVNTLDGSATAPADYTAIAPTVISLAPLTTSQDITVAVVADALVEENEQFFVQVNEAGGGTLLATGTGTILDDDLPSLSINDISVTEGTGPGTTEAVFTVTISANPRVAEPVSVSFATADGSAVAPDDYASTSGSLTFVSGAPLTQTISVAVVRDALEEDDETFQVLLSAPVAATLADGTGVATIIDDDGAPVPSVADVALPEGDAGGSLFEFIITLSNPSSFPQSFEVWTVDGSATAPSDYVAIPVATPQLVQFSPGQTSQSVSVQVNGDELVEGDETFSLIVDAPLVSGQGRGSLASATGTILNDDTATLSINSISELEGSGGGLTPFVFTLSSSRAFAEDVQIDYQTAPGTASDPEDYLGGPGSVTLPALAFSTTITIDVVADDVVELDETFSVILDDVTGATLGNAIGVATILDDDQPVDAVAIPASELWSLLLLLLGVSGLAAVVLSRRV